MTRAAKSVDGGGISSAVATFCGRYNDRLELELGYPGLIDALPKYEGKSVEGVI